MSRLLDQISGDVVYAIKPRLSSFGVGLIARQRYGLPLLLDIDDWDYKGQHSLGRLRRLANCVIHMTDPYAQSYLWLMQQLIPQASAVTTVSKLLQRRFGGTIIPHGCDTDSLDPGTHNGGELRRTWGLQNAKIVMFLGTPRSHKGVEDLIIAIENLDKYNIVLVIIGVDPRDPYTATLQARASKQLRLIGMQPITEIPRFLAAADIIALPQRDVPFAQAQVPAKIFDAMAMAKPIIATDVGDLAKTLDGTGIVVPPGNIPALSSAIEQLVTHTDLAHMLGQSARRRCVQNYSWDIMEQQLENIIERMLQSL